MAKAKTKKTAANVAGKKKSASKVAVAETEGEIAPAPEGSEAAYAKYLPDAERIDKSAIVPLRADPKLALGNVQIGVANVEAEGARLAALPETDVAQIKGLGDVLLAVVYAATQVQSATGLGVDTIFAIAYPLRSVLLKTAEALAEAKLLKQGDVDKIKAGRGRLDAATDLIALSALFTKNAAAIRGKHAISAAQIKQASTLGAELVKLVKPGRAKKSTQAAVGTDERDRLWTLAVQGYDVLWRAGAYLFGKDLVDEKVPPLLAGKGGRPKKPTAPTTPTTPTPTTPPDGDPPGT